MSLHKYRDRDCLAKGLASTVAMQLNQAIQRKRQAGIALAGGTSPATFMQALSQESLDWSKVSVTLTDERQVPAEHERSNAKLIADYLLKKIPEAQFIPLWGQSLDETVFALRRIMPLDVCVLGMGTDGHTASLFPKAEQLMEALQLDNDSVVMPIQPPNTSEARMSLTLASLIQSKHLHLLIQGQEKLAALEQVLAGDDELVMPMRSVIAHANARLTIHYAD